MTSGFYAPPYFFFGSRSNDAAFALASEIMERFSEFQGVAFRNVRTKAEARDFSDKVRIRVSFLIFCFFFVSTCFCDTYIPCLHVLRFLRFSFVVLSLLYNIRTHTLNS